ncbi:MAG: DUF3822 family protein [Marinirhabdus sp.]|nr:DUF3822 family protein [Marinirhabdus sp.]
MSVQVNLTGLSFLVKSQDQNQVLHYSERTFEAQYAPQDILAVLESEIQSNPIIKECKEICVVYAMNAYTLVPESLFDETKLSEYLKFNTKILAGDFVTFDKIDSHNINIVYVPLVNLNNYFFETFGSFQYFHATTILLTQLLDAEKGALAPCAYVHVTKDHIDVIALEKDQLVLCNSYPYKTPEDLAYYVLFAFEQIRFNPNTVRTTLLGAISEDDPNFAILYTYIRNISIDQELGDTTIGSLQPHEQFILKKA